MTDGSVSIYLPVGVGLALEQVKCPRVNVGQPRAPKLERFKCDFYRGQEHNPGWFQREVIEYVTLGRYSLRDATDPAFVGHWFYNDPSVRHLNIDCKWTGYHEPSRKQTVTIKNEWDQPITKLELAEALFKCIEQFLSHYERFGYLSSYGAPQPLAIPRGTAVTDIMLLSVQTSEGDRSMQLEIAIFPRSPKKQPNVPTIVDRLRRYGHEMEAAAGQSARAKMSVNALLSNVQ